MRKKKYIELFLESEPSTSKQSELSTKIQFSQKSEILLTSNEESDEVEAIEKSDETEVAIKTHKGTSLSINLVILMNKVHEITFSRPLLLEPANRFFTTSLPTNKFIGKFKFLNINITVRNNIKF